MGSNYRGLTPKLDHFSHVYSEKFWSVTTATMSGHVTYEVLGTAAFSFRLHVATPRPTWFDWTTLVVLG